MCIHLSKRVLVPTIAFLATASLAMAADTLTVNCDAGESLADVLSTANPGDTVLVEGTCAESVSIVLDRITLDGQGLATVSAGFAPGVVVDGAQGVILRGLTLRGSLFGLQLTNGASASMLDSSAIANLVIGVDVSANSSLTLENAVISNNSTFGLSISRKSEVRVTGTLTVENNDLFGVNVADASSLSFAEADVTVRGNVLGIQVSVGSSAFITDGATVVRTSDNDTTGFTVNSGSTLFLFEGTIISNRNRGNHGLSVSSNSSVDLDRDATIVVRANAEDGVRLENSHLNMFTMEGLDGPTVQAIGNARHGVRAFLASSIDLTFGAAIVSLNNGDAGLLVDNGSPVRIDSSTFTGNVRDVVLSFGARAELSNSTLGTFECDSSVLVRGDLGLACPSP